MNMTDLLRGVAVTVLHAPEVVAFAAAADGGHHDADIGSVAG